MALIGLDIDSCGCNTIEFNNQTNFIDEYTVQISNVDAVEASNSSMGTHIVDLTFPPPSSQTSTASVVSYTYPSPDSYKLWMCLDETKVTKIDFYDCNLSDVTLDLTPFTGLLNFAYANFLGGTEGVNTISFPPTAYNGIFPLTGNLYKGLYIYIEDISSITTLNFKAYEGDYNRIDLYLMSGLTSINFEAGWEGNKVLLYDCNALTTVDGSNIKMLPSDRWAQYTEFRVYTCTSVTTVTVPSEYTVADRADIIIEGNPALTYIDFSPMQSDVLGVDNDFQIYIRNNTFTAAEVNRILVEIDAITVTHTGTLRHLYMGGTNAAPDGTSGGYDGLTAKASLQGKGITVYTN